MDDVWIVMVHHSHDATVIDTVFKHEQSARYYAETMEAAGYDRIGCSFDSVIVQKHRIESELFGAGD